MPVIQFPKPKQSEIQERANDLLHEAAMVYQASYYLMIAAIEMQMALLIPDKKQ